MASSWAAVAPYPYHLPLSSTNLGKPSPRLASDRRAGRLVTGLLDIQRQQVTSHFPVHGEHSLVEIGDRFQPPVDLVGFCEHSRLLCTACLLIETLSALSIQQVLLL
jgi:hypothetical protein